MAPAPAASEAATLRAMLEDTADLLRQVADLPDLSLTMRVAVVAQIEAIQQTVRVPPRLIHAAS